MTDPEIIDWYLKTYGKRCACGKGMIIYWFGLCEECMLKVLS